ATPASWKRTEPTGFLAKFRLYQFEVPGADGNAEVIISPPAGGSVEANIERWKKQFSGKAASEPQVNTFKVDGVPVTYLDVSGSYQGAPFAPNAKTERKENYRLLGAIFESQNGPYFIRLIGPAKTVADNKQAYEQWLKSFKK